MNFLEECIQDSLPIWESCLNTKFLKGVADGSLPEECFKGYIVDDSLYLREYSKVFAWGMIHSRDMAEIRNYYSLLSFVNESEDATRRYYWPFVRDYAGNRYDAICRAWSEFTDQACQDLAPERAKKCREIFRACSLHELHFWEMSAHPREDLPTSP